MTSEISALALPLTQATNKLYVEWNSYVRYITATMPVGPVSGKILSLTRLSELELRHVATSLLPRHNERESNFS